MTSPTLGTDYYWAKLTISEELDRHQSIASQMPAEREQDHVDLAISVHRLAYPALVFAGDTNLPQLLKDTEVAFLCWGS